MCDRSPTNVSVREYARVPDGSLPAHTPLLNRESGPVFSPETIDGALNIATASVGRLHDAVDSLTVLLDLVLLPTPPTTEGHSDTPKPTTSEIGGRILSLDNGIEAATERIVALNHRLRIK